jgi:NADH/F420H2 dehydrogenase subunit C
LDKETWEEFKKEFPKAEIKEIDGKPTVIVDKEEVVSICDFLKRHGYTLSASISGVELPDKFEIIYHLFSISKATWCVVETFTSKDDPFVPSVYEVFKAADWQEREIYDMFGIIFEGHPDLRRILLEEGEDEFFPLRKDFKEDGPPN